jgi:myosin X
VFYKYETVLSFGAPVANKYKILVDGGGSLMFETAMVGCVRDFHGGVTPSHRGRSSDGPGLVAQVLEIAKLMKSYIKEVVTRRQ